MLNVRLPLAAPTTRCDIAAVEYWASAACRTADAVHILIELDNLGDNDLLLLRDAFNRLDLDEPFAEVCDALLMRFESRIRSMPSTNACGR